MGEENKTTYDNGILLNLKKSFKYAKGARLMLFLYIIFGAMLAFIGVIAPLLSAKELLYVTDGTLKKLVIIALCVFAVEISRNICRALSRITSRLFAREVMKHIQIDMAGEILKIKTADLDKKSSGVFGNIPFANLKFMRNISITLGVSTASKSCMRMFFSS
jgi:ABC-type multidrug transport system fused ATPase/permease subunit